MLWRVAPTAQVLDRWAGRPLPLTAAERARAARLRRTEDRENCVAVRLLARELAAEAAGASSGAPSAQAVSVENLSTGPRAGAPVLRGLPPGLEGLTLSLAHAGPWVAAAAAPGPVGTDVETLAHLEASGEAAHLALTPAEQALVRGDLRLLGVAWSAREALVKAGIAPLDDPRLDTCPLLEAVRATGQQGRAALCGLVVEAEIREDHVRALARTPPEADRLEPEAPCTTLAACAGEPPRPDAGAGATAEHPGDGGTAATTPPVA